MKYLLGTLVVLIGLLVPAVAFTWSESESSAPDDAALYEMHYTQCAFRHAASDLSENEIECICTQAAEHAVRWRGRVPLDKIPPLPDEARARCVDGR